MAHEPGHPPASGRVMDARSLIPNALIPSELRQVSEQAPQQQAPQESGSGGGFSLGSLASILNPLAPFSGAQIPAFASGFEVTPEERESKSRLRLGVEQALGFPFAVGIGMHELGRQGIEGLLTPPGNPGQEQQQQPQGGGFQLPPSMLPGGSPAGGSGSSLASATTTLDLGKAPGVPDFSKALVPLEGLQAPDFGPVLDALGKEPKPADLSKQRELVGEIEGQAPKAPDEGAQLANTVIDVLGGLVIGGLIGSQGGMAGAGALLGGLQNFQIAARQNARQDERFQRLTKEHNKTLLKAEQELLSQEQLSAQSIQQFRQLRARLLAQQAEVEADIANKKVNAAYETAIKQMEAEQKRDLANMSQVKTSNGIVTVTKTDAEGNRKVEITDTKALSGSIDNTLALLGPEFKNLDPSTQANVRALTSIEMARQTNNPALAVQGLAEKLLATRGARNLFEPEEIEAARTKVEESGITLLDQDAFADAMKTELVNILVQEIQRPGVLQQLSTEDRHASSILFLFGGGTK